MRAYRIWKVHCHATDACNQARRRISLYGVLSHDSKNIHAVQWAHSNARCTLQYNHRCAREQECAGASDARTHHGGADTTAWYWLPAECVCDTTAHIAPLTHHETSRLSIAHSLSVVARPSPSAARGSHAPSQLWIRDRRHRSHAPPQLWRLLIRDHRINQTFGFRRRFSKSW